MFDLEVKPGEGIHEGIKELFGHAKHRGEGTIQIVYEYSADGSQSWINDVDENAPATLGRDYIRYFTGGTEVVSPLSAIRVISYVQPK